MGDSGHDHLYPARGALELREFRFEIAWFEMNFRGFTSGFCAQRTLSASASEEAKNSARQDRRCTKAEQNNAGAPPLVLPQL